jgi:ATP-dependent DNA helicase 2 subunit 2
MSLLILLVLSALAVAIQMIDSATSNKAGKPLKYIRRVIIVTDGRGQMDTSDLEQIAMKINDAEAPVEILLLGVDFDDPDYGFKEEDKDTHKVRHHSLVTSPFTKNPQVKNEEVLKSFVEECHGNIGTLAEAIEQLNIPRLKHTHPTPSYRGQLTLGDAKTYTATLTIDVERYPCTMIAKPPSASSFVVRTDYGEGSSSAKQSEYAAGEDHPMGDLSAVRHQRSYQVEDTEEPGTKKNVEMDDLEKGYEYGRTAVHIAESDLNVVKLETEQSLQLVGFTREEDFQRSLPMGRTNYIVPQRSNPQAQLALSSFIHALHEGGLYAVARLVTKENKPPEMVLLVPRIEPEWEALVDVALPFEEDIRRYKFPPLDHKLTVSGKVITEHRDLPNKDLMGAMSDYVDAMDLSTFGEDEDGNADEYAKIEDTFSPILHRINHIIRWRATHPDVTTPIPDPPAILTKYSHPPPSLLSQSSTQLAALEKAADVKKVPPKVKGHGKRQRADREKPISGLDVDALLGNPKRVKIEPTNLVPSFKQALAATDDLAAIQEAADAMAAEIRGLVRNSVGDSAYGRALEALRVMRDEITELEEPEMYNDFIRALKTELLDGELGGDRREMWWRVRANKYGLVDQKRSLVSDVTEAEASDFYKG